MARRRGSRCDGGMDTARAPHNPKELRSLGILGRPRPRGPRNGFFCLCACVLVCMLARRNVHVRVASQARRSICMAMACGVVCACVVRAWCVRAWCVQRHGDTGHAAHAACGFSVGTPQLAREVGSSVAWCVGSALGPACGVRAWCVCVWCVRGACVCGACVRGACVRVCGAPAPAFSY